MAVLYLQSQYLFHDHIAWNSSVLVNVSDVCNNSSGMLNVCAIYSGTIDYLSHYRFKGVIFNMFIYFGVLLIYM